ncbi:class I SAM-dependent methyltransferase [Halopiger xanaduensis]|uniref:Methyltransferase type 11 n=1 Tax=Halopiger xanaduensis (strain DSM 18323 / JCM 14033 / SH-6) TaxID=797210 RepID=F8D8V6_HALXS|nr:class I SAM-dependent methyltransferase [Halopiger xanaduensis]AEH38020.1 Methyltransferase type 11 [Halopiger xanaduensis SH-6]
MDATATEPAYACGRCGRRLSFRKSVDEDGRALVCPNGDATIPVVDGVPRFPVPDGDSSHETLFDRLAPIYESPFWFDPLYRFVGGPAAPRDDRKTVVEMLELEDIDVADGDTPTVLDVACGTGRIARPVAAAANVVGIDISAGMLERAMRYAARDGVDVAFARMSADDLWFDANAFDRATCCWALHLLPDPDAVLEEIARVLRSDGMFVGTALVEDYVLELLPVRATAKGVLDVEPFDATDLRRRLRTAGFSSVEFDRRGAALFFRARCE